MHILIVDNNPKRLDWFQDVLEPAGHDVRLADTLDAGLDQFRDCEFDLAFFDHDIIDPDQRAPAKITYSPYKGRFNGIRLLEMIKEADEYTLPKKVWVHGEHPLGSKTLADRCASMEIPVHREPFQDVCSNPDMMLETLRGLDGNPA
jgi:CheY-like chemotaxis protein